MAKKRKETTSADAMAKQAAMRMKLTELANSRVSRAVKTIGLVGNLANYKPSSAQTDAILKALVDACNTVAARLKSGTGSGGGFTLPE